ncbi:MAG TPA: acetyl-CoA carboxylase biotin carboxylase subunit [Aggregatilineales bacterium]|nr:acetyl-CoA carboxylase biotin carboxylase subunit [Anaerolineae bacterium]HUN06579.1 acetyl-CoA carboxylase biotin carboxylase subunit [Aggregatilineales bacterium]
MHAEQGQKIKKILVANRGEIAVRVIRACRDLGIGSVAVYSDADRAALHVRYADEAIHIGPPPPRESYLLAEKIIAAAKKTGADAIHPGYGFLSERSFFAQMCADEGIIFIGPPPKAIDLMGDKQTARETVKKNGVKVVPGTEPGESDENLLRIAPSFGFPVLIKATAGGGGKGMRAVYREEDLAEALASARREAESAFGNGDVYIEKLLVGARHIEFQILADQHGNTIHLGERECSIQRRHQKLVEESPSVVMDVDLREKMGKMAVAAAESCGYVNAGTIECLVDKDLNYYFLEMNTRLQVEHPVTELVTGVDLVKEQIRIARGRRMGPTESFLHPKGHAIECRINAEDPYNGFIPSTGKISTLLVPTGPGVRVDSGVYSGYEITPYYDSMIAKLICWGEDRGEALLRMRRALEEYTIMGVKHNIPFHQNLMSSFSFMAGKFDTKWVEDHFSMTTYEEDPSEQELETAAIAATLFAHRQRQLASQVVTKGERDTSNWKWVGRWERMHR